MPHLASRSFSPCHFERRSSFPSREGVRGWVGSRGVAPCRPQRIREISTRGAFARRDFSTRLRIGCTGWIMARLGRNDMGSGLRVWRVAVRSGPASIRLCCALLRSGSGRPLRVRRGIALAHGECECHDRPTVDGASHRDSLRCFPLRVRMTGKRASGIARQERRRESSTRLHPPL
jgi:hypothetical protein